MWWIILGLHLTAALITTIIVTWQLAQVTDPVSKVTLGLVTFIVASVGGWPVMLWAARRQSRREGDARGQRWMKNHGRRFR